MSKKELLLFKKQRAEKIRNFILSNPDLSLDEYCEKLGFNKSIVSGVIGSMSRFGITTNKVVSKPTKNVKEIQQFIIDNNKKLSREEIMKSLDINLFVYRANLASINKRYNKKVVSGVFTHEESIVKEVLYRNPIIEKITQSSLKNGVIVSLPAKKFITEKRIFNEISKNFDFIGVERNDDIYYELLKNLSKNQFKMVVYPTDLSKVLTEMKENSVSHLIADYCGQLHTHEKEITDAIKRNIVKVDGVITITINKRITGAENHKFYDEMISLNNTEMYNHLSKVEKAFKIFLERLCGFDYKLETYLDYHSNKSNGGKCANMMLAIIKRVK